MATKSSVSISVIRRLPRYYRFLGELQKSGVNRISSRELSEKMGITASQIRQDLNCFGGFGQQGYGYNVTSLREEIANILGLNTRLKTVLIGAGNLGSAIVSYLDFKAQGFELIGIFDENPDVINREFNDIFVQDSTQLKRFCNEKKPEVAILCIPRSAAETLSKQLIDSGIRCFWNFSHYDLTLHHDNIIVENVHLTDSLMTLGYRSNEFLRKK